MKKQLFRIVGVAVTIALTICGINKLGYLVRPVDTDIAINTINTFHDMPENTFEVIGYGSSHMWRGMSAMELYDKFGIGAYNYGCNWQNINTTQLFLEDSLITQKPKVVLIETYVVGNLKYNMNIDGEIYYTTAIKEGDAKKRYLNQCFGNVKGRYLSYYMPLCAFHDNWVNLSWKSFEADNSYSCDFYKTMGFVGSDGVTPVVIPDQSAAEQSDLGEYSLQTLENIVQICNENDIDIIFYTAPWQGTYCYSDAMKKFASANDCVYFNLFEYIEEIGIDGETDFSDEGHLNTSGSVKVADFLGEYLKEHYDLTDFRNVDNNIWEQNK